MSTITVIKQDYQGKETHRYSGRLIERSPHEIKIEAFFDLDEIVVGGIILDRGDRFIESYFDNRWYNILEIHDRTDDHIKGWYCNICYPPHIHEGSITYRDLALDLLVYPDGNQVVLDKDEFNTLPISPHVRSTARKALLDLQALFE